MTTRVSDVMTTRVVTVTPDTDFKTIAGLLNHHRINLIPVIDSEHRVVGVVSEADLLAKLGWQGRNPGRIERWLLADDEMRKAHGTSASEVMTAEVETVRPEATVAGVAQTMMADHVKSIPVVDSDDRLVGIVSRADLLRSFIRDDALIQDEVLESVLHGALSIDPDDVTVDVIDGTVVLHGEVESRSLKEMATRMVGEVPGVVSVVNAMDGRVDDHHLKSTREPADALTYSGPPLH